MTTLQIAQIVPRTHAEGPGLRFAVWVQGCPIRCPGCCNPQMFAEEGGTESSPVALVREAAAAGVEGITLLGGEPFAQAAGCAELASLCHQAGLSVMVFTGYTLAELESRHHEPGVRELLDRADLLVDGRFELADLDTTRRWIGSSNQTLHFRSPRYSPDDPRFRAANTAEIRLTRSALTMNGWPGLLPKVSGPR